jgi:hypothetical protein
MANEMMSELRDALSVAMAQLLQERDAAAAAGQAAKVTVADTELDRIETVLATVQFAINNDRIVNLNAVAARLQEIIEAQRAIGLKAALGTLGNAIANLAAGGETGPATGGGGRGRRPPSPTTSTLRAKPGKHQLVVSKLIDGAIQHGLDPMTVLTIVAIESDFDPAATNTKSSAAGLFQFIDSTWIAAGGEKFPGRGGIGNGHAAGASIDDQIDIGCKFTVKNIKALTTKLGSVPSRTAIYMAHQQGLGGAGKILSADPNASIESMIGVDAARNNALGGLTVGQTVAKFGRVVRSNEDEASALVVMAEPAPGEIGGAPSNRNGSGTPTLTLVGPKAVEVALLEMEMFARRNGVTLAETQEPLSARVLEYFRFVGRLDISSPSAEPWSAAFISFVLHKAGASLFPKSAAHSTYILAGLANRMSNRFDAPVVFFDRDEKPPRVGDLIGFSRTPSVQSRADIERFLPNKFFPSHTDLVVDVSPGKLKVIGGNVSQTIKTTTVKADADGKIDPTAEHFFVLRLNM